MAAMKQAPRHPRAPRPNHCHSTADEFPREIGEAPLARASYDLSTPSRLPRAIGWHSRHDPDFCKRRASADKRAQLRRKPSTPGSAAWWVMVSQCGTQKQTASQLKDTNVFAVLTLPETSARPPPFLEGAVADATSRSPAQPLARPAEGRRNASTEIRRSPSSLRRGSRQPTASSGESGFRWQQADDFKRRRRRRCRCGCSRVVPFCARRGARRRSS